MRIFTERMQETIRECVEVLKVMHEEMFVNDELQEVIEKLEDLEG